MTEIYLTISLSTHNGDDTPQKCDEIRGNCAFRFIIAAPTAANLRKLEKNIHKWSCVLTRK